MTTKKEDKRNLQQRLAAVMMECTYIRKDKPKGMQYAIVSHDKVTAKVRPYLLKHGIRYNSTVIEHGQEGNRTWVRMNTTFINIDSPEQTETTTTLGYGIDSQDKGPGKAMSYAVKYALLKTLALETGEDADMESIEYDPRDTVDNRSQPKRDEPQKPEANTFIQDQAKQWDKEVKPEVQQYEREPDEPDDGKYEAGAIYEFVKKELGAICKDRNLKKSDLNTWIKSQYNGNTIAVMKNQDGILLEVLRRVKSEYSPAVGDSVNVGGAIAGTVVNVEE